MSIDTNLLKQRVKGMVVFNYFQDMNLYYRTDDGWTFPIPVSDTVNGQGSAPVFPATEKAIQFMRWIRKHMEYEVEIRQSED